MWEKVDGSLLIRRFAKWSCAKGKGAGPYELVREAPRSAGFKLTGPGLSAFTWRAFEDFWKEPLS